MKIKKYVSVTSVFFVLISIGCKEKEKLKQTGLKRKPNIVMIYADDLGYGDIGAYGAITIQTPAIDALAEEGIAFYNAYATAATCTPSRYSLLTGVYAWRKKGNSIASGDQPLLFDTSKPTLVSILQSVGYKTGVVGKWHLGLGGKEGPDWNGIIKPGPLEIGFDYSFLIPATGDRVPCVFVENHNIVNLDPSDPIRVNYKHKIGNWPTGSENPELLKVKPSQGHANTIVNGISRIGFMEGGKAALWDDETIAQQLVKKSVDFINSNKESPFFLFLSTHDIHVPRVPNKMFQGKSGMGSRGDVILQLDWTVKQIVSELKAQNLWENTVIIFSSDNGPVLDDGYHDQARALVGNHKPTGGLRGGKYSAYDGGSKIPLIIRWPDGKSKGIASNALVSQVDFFKSLGKLAGVDILKYKNMDSQNQLSALRGEDKNGREAIIQESFAGPLSYIKGHWKYIEPLDGPKLVPWGPIIETGFEVVPQLYNLKADPREQNNVAKDYPEKVETLRTALMEARKGLSFTMFKPKIE
ncbi:arylsulfatase [Snuella lapsa]|uniref:Arylsulfatase n=1 Tax=Snuella lapsa TaxID=870481 RepID=A0ABP6WXU9_9FLAO